MHSFFGSIISKTREYGQLNPN
jgi:hypothetical protein